MTTVMDLAPDQIKGRRLRFDDLPERDGRLEWWEPPRPGAVYTIGADMAYGIAGRDYDAAVVLRVCAPPIVQVAEVHGHWGPRFDRLLYALARLYNDAFIVGERQVGLFALSSLYHQFGYTNLYGDRDETKTSRKSLKALGYHRGTGDVTLPKLRRAVIAGELIIRSEATLTQMSQFQFRPRESVSLEDATDADMKTRLVTGGSPDLVMAAAYAYHGAGEVQWVVEEPRGYEGGTMGELMGHGPLLDRDEDDEDYHRPTRRRR